MVQIFYTEIYRDKWTWVPYKQFYWYKKIILIFQTMTWERYKIGDTVGPSLLPKMHVYGKKSAEYDGSYLVNLMKRMNNYGIKNIMS